MSDINPVFDPLQKKMVSGPEAGQNVTVNGFEVNFTGASTSGVYNAGSGLTLSGNVFAADVADVGFGMELNGGTASYARYRTIETVSGGTVTLMAGHAYKAYATTSPLTITAEAIPANMYGQEGHLEVYLANASYVVADPQKVVLRDALEPDSVNNLTCRFHDGLCILSVEDHFAGYIVVSATGTAAGTLPYALSSVTQEYVAFDATTNGATIDFSGATASAEKHLVGNGYTSTTLTGAVDCGTSKFTVANLALSDVQVTGGVMTLGDAYIPSGSTVAVSGGGLAVEKVTGAGSASVIDLGGTTVTVNTDALVSGATITNGGASSFYGSGRSATLTMVDCTVVGNASPAIHPVGQNRKWKLSNCTVSGSNTLYVYYGASCTLIDCNVESAFVNGTAINEQTATILLSGSNTIGTIKPAFGSGTVTLTSGAILDLTGNANATPIVPGGGITFESGGATVLTGATAGTVDAQYTLDNVTLPAGAKLTNTAVVDLAGSGCIGVPNSATIRVSGAYITSGASAAGINTGGINAGNFVSATLENCAIVDNIGTYNDSKDLRFGVSCTVTLFGTTTGGFYLDSGSILDIAGYCYTDRYVTPNGSINISSGATINISGTSAGNPVITGAITFDADVTIVNSAGTSILLNNGSAGTCNGINKDGSLVE